MDSRSGNGHDELLPGPGPGPGPVPDPTPTITNVQPAQAAPGAQVVVTGTRLNLAKITFQVGGATAVLAQRVGTATTSQVTVVVPTLASLGGAGGGAAVVAASTGGSSAPYTAFVVLESQRPSAQSVTPNAALGGAVVTIAGRGFGVNLGGAGKVVFGTSQAAVKAWSASSIDVYVPADANGNVVVQTPWGSSDGLAFTLRHKPQVAGVDVVVAGTPLAPGARVLVRGSYFTTNPRVFFVSGSVSVEAERAAPPDPTTGNVVVYVPGSARLPPSLGGSASVVVQAADLQSAPYAVTLAGRPSITSWTRLEPRARVEDLERGLALGLQARVADAAWLLARQWQLGEFAGADAGSPVVATVTAETAPLARFAPASVPVPTQADVARAAYARSQARLRTDAAGDWTQAESQLRAGGGSPSQADIARRAYALWQARVHPQEVTDWLTAERQLSGAGPTHVDIQRLAYSLWEARGRGPGHALDDWLSAERQLIAAHAPPHDQVAQLAYTLAGQRRRAQMVGDWLTAERQAAASAAASASVPYAAGTPLEVTVEREEHALGPGAAAGLAARAGLQLVRLIAVELGAAKAADYRRRFAGAYPLQPPEDPGSDRSAAYLGLMTGRVPDGGALYAALHPALPPSRGGTGTLPTTPPIDAADASAILRAIAAWYDWCDGAVSTTDAGRAAWVDEQLSYAFSVSAETSAGELVLGAREHVGDDVDWYSFDTVPNTSLRVSGAGPPPREQLTRSIVPAAVRYPGMPARRWWEFEDASVDFGSVRAGAADLAHLFLVEFATVFGNDWFVLPLDRVQVGSVLQLTSLVVKDSFGRTIGVPRFSSGAPGWRMFELSGGENGAAPNPDLFLAPTAASLLESDPVEDVLFLRDELASLAWAVERVVETPSGLPVRRADVEHAAGASPQPSSNGQPATGEPPPLRYRLATDVPTYWIPLVPERAGGAFRFLRAALRRPAPDGTLVPVAPLGAILEPDRPALAIRDDAISRSGALVTRAYRRTRGPDGSTYVWVGRRRRAGFGEGSSGLRFDDVDDGRT